MIRRAGGDSLAEQWPSPMTEVEGSIRVTAQILPTFTGKPGSILSAFSGVLTWARNHPSNGSDVTSYPTGLKIAELPVPGALHSGPLGVLAGALRRLLLRLSTAVLPQERWGGYVPH